MTFYLIGLGLNLKSISVEALKILEKCDKIYLENYTVDFPYETKELENIIKKEIKELGREKVENDEIIKQSEKENIALLVYGSPLFATTHMTLIKDANEQKVEVKIIYSASIFDALAETGLQLYKFGKITSMPGWKKNYKPDSFIEIIKENQSIKAHSLILIDIGLAFKDALKQFEKACENKNLKLDKILICSKMGTNKKEILYKNLDNLKKENISSPFCFIIPGEMHFMEKEVLENFG